MKRSVLKNPRARRMLDLLQPNCRDENDGCFRHEAVKEAVNKIPTTSREEIPTTSREEIPTTSREEIPTSREEIPTTSCEEIPSTSREEIPTTSREEIPTTSREEIPTTSREERKTEINVTKKYNTRNKMPEYNYNEQDNNNEDFSPESSEYVPSPYRKIRSNTPSTTSSIGGDSFCIDKMIHSSNMRSPSTISNLSLVFDNVDFVASPSAIYKVSNKRENPQQHENGTKTDPKVHNCSLEPNYLKAYSKNSSTISDQAENFAGNETMTPDKIDITLKPNESTIEYNEIINGLSSWASSNDDVLHEDTQTDHYTPHQEIVLETLNDTALVQPLQLSPSILNNQNNNNRMRPESDTSEPNESHEASYQKGSRKRKFDQNEWKDIKQKKLKNSGKAYVGCRSKKSYAAKTIGPVCSCKKMCSEKFTSQQRESFFNTFYKLQSHELQWQYITRRITTNPIKRLTLERKNNRTQTLKYSFPLDGCHIPVCKIYFLNTLKISEQVVYTALEKIKRDQSLTDERGTHLNRPHKMSVTTKETIMKHINLFPAVESHYVRKDSKRQYLSEQLNISKMYRLYQIWFKNQNYPPENLGSKRQYETVFNTEYNFSFYKPKKDLCAICSLYEQAEDAKKASLEENYRAHVDRKNRVRELKKEEKAAVDPKNTTVAVFDLEKVLSVPQSEVGIFYYKRKYPIYNFTVFNTLNKSGYCYVWHLSVAKRGANEIGSCVLQFIVQEAQRGIKNISFYSDGCAGQNKNRFIFAMYLYALKTYGLETITHRFFETGHSQSEGDSMHSCIERAMKNKVLYTPDQVYSVILNAKLKGEKYNLREMEQNGFYDLKCLISGKNWQKDTQGRKISWSKVMEVKVSHLRPHVLQCKYDFGEDYFDLDTVQGTVRAKRGRPPKNLADPLVDESLKQVYSQPIPIPKPLYDDLHGLCASEAIPKHYHVFYKTLVSCENPEPQNLDEIEGSDQNDDEISV